MVKHFRVRVSGPPPKRNKNHAGDFPGGFFGGVAEGVILLLLLSGSCEVETHDEPVARPLWGNPEGLCLFFERRDEFDVPPSILQFLVGMSVNEPESQLLPECMSGAACHCVDDGDILE